MKKIQLLINFIKDCKSGRYKLYSKMLFVSVFIGFLYLIMPADFIPDWVPFAGFIDDAAVIGLVYKQLNKDLEKYKLWKEKGFYL